MKIELNSVMVDDQDKALTFYTEVLGYPLAASRRSASQLIEIGGLGEIEGGCIGLGEGSLVRVVSGVAK